MNKAMGLLAVMIAVLWTGIGWAEIPKKDALNAKEPDNAEKTRIQSAYGKLPLYFIQNDGQVDKRVKYYEKGAGHATFFAEDGVYLNLTKAKPGKDTKDKSAKPEHSKDTKQYQTETVKLSLIKSNQHPRIVAEDQQAGKINYFTGNDKSQWKTDIPTYSAVRYEEAYKGVDVRYYGNNSQIEYDVIVKPGADPKQVKFQYQGIKGLKVTEAGELEIRLKEGNIVQKKPVIYQEVDGKRVAVYGKFKILARKKGQFSYGFQVAAYDTTRDLVIDPTLVYSTYLGGSGVYTGYSGGGDFGTRIAIDGLGNAYIVGHTNSTDFPSASPIQPINGGSTADVFVTKINAAGSALVYSTYMGGAGIDRAWDIAVDGSGNVYITGDTNSINFPTASPIQATNGGGYDAFVTKINAAGTALVYSTYLGGANSDFASSIAVDGAGNAYVAGKTLSTDFPTASPIQATIGGGYVDAFVTKIDASGTAFVYSTYLGGAGDDRASGIAVDGSGNAYVTGYTMSTNFPTASPIQATIGGTEDAFVTKINAAGSALVYSTYLGGASVDSASGIAVDGSGNLYVTGNTWSTDFPTASPIQATIGGNGDAFVTKINAAGTALVYSTYLGGANSDFASSIAVDGAGNAYVAGYTESTNFPTVLPIQATNGGNGDAFVTKINAADSALVYSTYLGGRSQDGARGIAVDGTGNAYVAGYTGSTNFPTASPIQATNGGYYDAFVAKIASNTSPTLFYSAEAGYGADGVNPNSGTASTTMTYKVVYTDADNQAPASIPVCIDALPCSAMSVDTSAAAALHDGNYANGEQYVYTSSLAAGVHSYYFVASDGATSVNLPASGSLSGPSISNLTISTATLPDGTVGAAYSQTLTATGGTAPYSWLAPGLPGGLSLNTSSGVISGTPTTVGLTGFSASVTDAASAVVSKAFSITVAAPVNTGNVTIVASGSSSGGSWVGNTWSPSATGSTVLASEVASHLALGATTINTLVSGDIIVNGAVSWTTNNTLTLNSVNDIKIYANISATGNSAGLVLGYGSGRSYTLANGKSITLSGATPTLKIGVTGSEATYTVINSLGVAGDMSATTLQGMNGNLAGRYALGSSIDATATSGWNAGAGFAPIGNNSTLTAATQFIGIFDGLGHTVSNLTINLPTTNNVGLFGYAGTGSAILNVGMVGGSVIGQNSVGGLVGGNWSSTISNSYATGNVSGLDRVGGLLGDSANGTISNSYATGSVSGRSDVGGLVGSKSSGSISNSYATGSVIGTGFYIGGLVGGITQVWISNAYSTGAVSGSTYVGGLVGSSNQGSIYNAYSTGAVSGSTYVGGLVGSHSPAPNPTWCICNSFWDTQTSGQLISAGGTGLTTANMMTQTNFTSATPANGNVNPAWDFTNIWWMSEGNTRPFLRNVTTPVGLSPTSISFASQNIGVTSTAQAVILANNSTAMLNISSIAASGDYARTTTCAATLAAGANCTISVTFTPTATGTRTGAITITSDAASSPNTVSLSGAGIAPLASQTIGPISFSPTTLAVGSTTTVSATATSGLAVTFSSLTLSTCTVSGSTITGVANGTCTIAANQAGDANYNAATQVTQNITVSNLTISTATLPDGTVGTAYSQALAATGGTAPYTWSAPGLPAGLSLNTSTGIISGIPTTVGLTGFSASVTDTASAVFAKAFSINVAAAPTTGGGTWTTKAPMPVTRFANTVAGIGNLLYAVGGTDYVCGAYSTLEVYDPATNTWTAKAAMPTARWSLSSAVVNGILYAVGGTNGCYTPNPGMNTVEAYDPATNTWTAKAPMPTARGSFAVGVVNGIIYAVGGSGNAGTIATVEAYDPATNTWTTKAPLPVGRYNLGVGVVNGILYAVGGYSSNTGLAYATLDAYDPATNTWTTLAPMPTVRASIGVGVVNGILYVVGGQYSAPLTTVEAYNPATNTWTTVAPMSTARSELAVGVANNILYAVGGGTSGGPTATVEAYTPSAITGITTLIGGAIQGVPLNITISNAAVTTLAGSAGIAGSTDGTGTAARFYWPWGITTDGTNLFVAENVNHTIRKIVISTGEVTTLAGTAGTSGSTDGIGTAARFYGPWGITTDGTNLFVADRQNGTIRKVVISTGEVTTLAGTAGTSGSTDGTGSAARFWQPAGMTTDGTNLFVTDESNHTIRKVVISTGDVTTIAGSAGSAGSTDGTGAAARFNDPMGITTDGTNLFVADTINYTIRKVVISTGEVSTLAGTAGISGSTDGTSSAARFSSPAGLTTDGINLFVTDVVNHTIRKLIISTGEVSTLAGTAGISGSTDGTGAAASFNNPHGITTDGTSLFVADTINYTIRKISPASSDTTPPTTTASPAGGTYTSTQSVILSCSDGTGSGCGNIYYTSNGTTPDIFSTIYTVPINISANTTLKYFAVDLAGNGELVKTQVYTIVSGIGIDLTVSSLSAPVSAATGTNISIPNTIRNLGTVTSTTSYVKFYLSSDTVIDATTDVYLAQRSAGGLAAGASSSATTSLKIPVSVAPGTYYIGAIADATNTNTESDETNNTASTTAITVSSGVDLTVSSFSAPLSIATGLNVSLSSTIRNLGTGATVTSYVKFYLSTDAAIDSSDTYLTQRSIGALAGGASSSATTTIKLPVTLSPGTYYIGAIADETNTNIESNETNNKAVTGAITVLSGVDLAVSTFSVPSSIETGTSVVVSNTVTNSGVGATATSYLKIYLSTDSTIDISDTYLTQRSVSSLIGGLSSSASTTIKLPVTLSPGTYYIGAIADATNTNIESNEANNTAASSAITVTSGVDLVVSSLSAPSTIATGVNVSLSNTVANLGPGATATSYLKIYLSTDSTIDSSDTYLSQRSVGSIAGGASSSASTTIKLPVTLSPGTYYIGAIADETNTNVESDETNNTAFTAAITVTVQSGIDFVVSSFSAPSTIYTGTNVSISNTVTNNGVGTSSTSYVKFYLSTDAAIDSSDTYITQRSVSSLNGGLSSSASTTIKLPVTLSPGTYYIGAIADETNTNVESDETNNTAVTGAITVTSGADLVVSSLSAPSTIETGVNVSLSATVTNNGVGATATSYLKIYLSTDSTIDSSDTYITQRSVSSLIGGASSSASTTIKLPVTLSPGTYYIGAIADETNTNIESDETNNKAVSGAITVLSGVDLAVSAFNVPSAITSGLNATISNTVTNNGVGASATSYLKIYLSTDENIDSSDTYLIQRSVSSLAGGGLSTASTTIKLPVTLSPGTYYIGAIADETNANVESDETNNKAVSGAITVTSGADLVVSSLSAPSTIETGVNVSLSTTVTNNGVGATATSYLKIYLSTDSTIDSSDTYLSQRSVSSIAGGASSSASTTIKLPVTLNPGTYYIGAIADETNTNIESDETNNKAVSGAITVTSGVDLTVSTLSAPGSAVAGTNVSVSNTVINNGTGTSTTSYVKLYLSSDTVIDPATDTYLTQRSIGAIAGGGLSSGNTTISLPVTLSPGTYYIGAIADATNTNSESDEANNIGVTEFLTVTSP